jgi:D-alanyl-D-alanine carboxypeptidase/D-alanyl-D-alanine-endopeptidase (penicillin-binding protein 4)
VTPDCEYVEIQARARTSKRRRARIAIDSATVRVGRGGERMRISVSGQIGAGMSRVFYRVPRNRVLFTGNVLHSELARAGITVTGTVRRRTFEEYQAAAQGFAAPPRALAIHRSEPLRDLVAQVNKRSDNYLADQLITMAAAVRHRAEPSLARGVDVMKQWLERIGIPRGKIQIDTGSGLSYRTRITARQLVQVLRAASGLGAGAAGAQPVATTGKTGAPAVTGIPSYASDWLRSLAVAGRDGTLRGRFRGSAVRERMIGKTGTLTGIIALTGIVSDEDGSALCFAIVTNRGRHRQRGHIRREHEAIVEALHQYLVEKRTGVRAPLADPASAPATGEPDRAFELDESLETEAAPAAPR